MAQGLGNTDGSVVAVDYRGVELSVLSRLTSEEIDDLFYPGDLAYTDDDFDEDLSFKEWVCVQCKGHFIDADDHPDINKVPAEYASIFKGIEPQMYWLGPNELFCASCAQPRGIPPTL
jgi:hypothetical protein